VIKVKQPAQASIPVQPTQEAIPQPDMTAPTPDVGAVDFSQQPQPMADPNASAAPEVPMTTPDMGAGTEGGEEMTFNEIQKTTGKLAQDMREIAQQLTNKEYKYIINSVLSAVDVTKLTDKDKEQIMNKLNGKEEAQQDANLSEVEGDDDNEDNTYAWVKDFMAVPIISKIVKMAGLDNYENQASLAFDISDAIRVYINDYNEDIPFIHYLESILYKFKYKPSPLLRGYNDLDEDGKDVYLSLVKFGEMEDSQKMINEEKQTIYSNIIKDIKKKLNKI